MKGNITENTVINTAKFLKSNHFITIRPQLVSNSGYPLHQNITTTYFWIGEPASVDNQYTDNLSSFWDSKWVIHYGGVDDPDHRSGYFPTKFVPQENPFYVALPYSDFFDNGTRKPNVYDVVYWSNEKKWSGSESMVKNKWIHKQKETKLYTLNGKMQDLLYMMIITMFLEILLPKTN